MLLLGRDWLTSDLPESPHRTWIRQCRAGTWWWHCRGCGDHGSDVSWPRVLTNARRHAQGLPTTG